MKINDFNVNVKVKNNKKKYTLLSIHGVNSSMDFTRNLDELKNNFNHIKISMPIVGTITIDDLNTIVSTLIKKHIKTKNLIILGHSLGGIQVANNHQHKKVKKVIYVSPFNPSSINDFKKIFANIIFAQSKVASILKKGIKLYQGRHKRFVSAILSEDQPYLEIFRNSLLNNEFINDLDKKYKANKKDTLYIIGNKDMVIDPIHFKKYLENMDKKLNIVEAEHNPFVDDMKKTHELINDFIPDKETFFRKKLFKE